MYIRFKKIFCTLLLPSIAIAYDCTTAASKNSLYTNNQCRELCESDDSSFSNFCLYEPFSFEHQRVIPEGTCYDQWIPGYSDEGLIGQDVTLNNNVIDHHIVGEYIVGLSSPQECQQACQDSPTCIFFIYRALENPDGNDFEKYRGCILKNEELVQSSASMPLYAKIFPVPASDPRWLRCNLGFAWECHKGGHTCLKCFNVPVCVWKGVHFISGPKFCTLPKFDFCPYAAKTIVPGENPELLAAGETPPGVGTTMPYIVVGAASGLIAVGAIAGLAAMKFWPSQFMTTSVVGDFQEGFGELPQREADQAVAAGESMFA